MRYALSLVAAILMLAVVACADAAPHYTYAAPHTPGTVLCTTQCRKAFDFCHQSCALDQHRCVSAIQASSLADYDRYARERHAAHQTVDRPPSSFEHTDDCRAVETQCMQACDKPYNACYTQCGGTVTEQDAPWLSCLFSSCSESCHECSSP